MAFRRPNTEAPPVVLQSLEEMQWLVQLGVFPSDPTFGVELQQAISSTYGSTSPGEYRIARTYPPGGLRGSHYTESFHVPVGGNVYFYRARHVAPVGTIYTDGAFTDVLAVSPVPEDDTLFSSEATDDHQRKGGGGGDDEGIGPRPPETPRIVRIAVIMEDETLKAKLTGPTREIRTEVWTKSNLRSRVKNIAEQIRQGGALQGAVDVEFENVPQRLQETVMEEVRLNGIDVNVEVR